MPRVHLPDGRVVHFPDGMAPDQIKAEVTKLAGGRDPAIPDPSTFLPMSEGERAFHDTVREEAAPFRDPATLNAMGGIMIPTAGAGRLFSGAKEPAGRALATSGKALERAGRVTKPLAPMAVGGALLTGDVGTAAMAAVPYAARAAGRGLQKAGASLASKVTGATKTATSAAKPKLSAQEVAQYLRKEYGSEQAGRMLYGKGQAGAIAPAARTEAIKRLAPGQSTLPQAAQRQIQQQLQSQGPSEAWNYVTKAPNARAREYLLSLMRGK